MELNVKKCREMLVDFRKVKTTIPPITIGEDCFTKVKSYKLLGVWLDDDLKWTTGTAHIIKKAVKRLYLLKVLKSYNAPVEDLKTFYTGVIRSVLEYGTQIWNGSLTSAEQRYREDSKTGVKNNLSGDELRACFTPVKFKNLKRSSG